MYYVNSTIFFPDSDVMGYAITITRPLYFLLVPILFRRPTIRNRHTCRSAHGSSYLFFLKLPLLEPRPQ